MSDITANSVDALNTDPSARYYVREHHPQNGTLLGFWIYLMSDALIFATLFAIGGGRGGLAARRLRVLPGAGDGTGRRRVGAGPGADRRRATFGRRRRA